MDRNVPLSRVIETILSAPENDRSKIVERVIQEFPAPAAPIELVPREPEYPDDE